MLSKENENAQHEDAPTEGCPEKATTTSGITIAGQNTSAAATSAVTAPASSLSVSLPASTSVCKTMTVVRPNSMELERHINDETDNELALPVATTTARCTASSVRDILGTTESMSSLSLVAQRTATTIAVADVEKRLIAVPSNVETNTPTIVSARTATEMESATPGVVSSCLLSVSTSTSAASSTLALNVTTAAAAKTAGLTTGTTVTNTATTSAITGDTLLWESKQQRGRSRPRSASFSFPVQSSAGCTTQEVQTVSNTNPALGVEFSVNVENRALVPPTTDSTKELREQLEKVQQQLNKLQQMQERRVLEHIPSSSSPQRVMRTFRRSHIHQQNRREQQKQQKQQLPLQRSSQQHQKHKREQQSPIASTQRLTQSPQRPQKQMNEQPDPLAQCGQLPVPPVPPVPPVAPVPSVQQELLQPQQNYDVYQQWHQLQWEQYQQQQLQWEHYQHWQQWHQQWQLSQLGSSSQMPFAGPQTYEQQEQNRPHQHRHQSRRLQLYGHQYHHSQGHQEVEEKPGDSTRLTAPPSQYLQPTSSKKPNTDHIEYIFPHIAETHRLLRLAISSEGEDRADKVMKTLHQYTAGCRNEYEKAVTDPAMSRKLARSVSRVLDLLFDLSDGLSPNSEYMCRICELVALYISCELSYAREIKDCKQWMVNRIAHIIQKHLEVEDEVLTKKNILHMFVYIPNMFNERAVMSTLFKMFLQDLKTSKTQLELPDNEYVQYIIIFYQWLRMEIDVKKRARIIERANRFMRPCQTLLQNRLYMNHLPKFSMNQTATKDILENLRYFQDLKNASLYDNNIKDLCEVIDVSEDEKPQCNDDDEIVKIYSELPLSVQYKNLVKSEEPVLVDEVDLTADDDADVVCIDSDTEENQSTTSQNNQADADDDTTEPELFGLDFEAPEGSSGEDPFYETDFSDNESCTDYDYNADSDDNTEEPLRSRFENILRTYLLPKEKEQHVQEVSVGNKSHVSSALTNLTQSNSTSSATATTSSCAVGTAVSDTEQSAQLLRAQSASTEFILPRIVDSFSCRRDSIHLISTPYTERKRLIGGASVEVPSNAGRENLTKDARQVGGKLPQQDEGAQLQDEEEYHSVLSTSSSSSAISNKLATFGQVIYSQANLSRRIIDFHSNNEYDAVNEQLHQTASSPVCTTHGAKSMKKQVKFNENPIGPTPRSHSAPNAKVPISKPPILVNRMTSNQQATFSSSTLQRNGCSSPASSTSSMSESLKQMAQKGMRIDSIGCIVQKTLNNQNEKAVSVDLDPKANENDDDVIFVSTQAIRSTKANARLKKNLSVFNSTFSMKYTNNKSLLRNVKKTRMFNVSNSNSRDISSTNCTNVIVIDDDDDVDGKTGNESCVENKNKVVEKQVSNVVTRLAEEPVIGDVRAISPDCSSSATTTTNTEPYAEQMDKHTLNTSSVEANDVGLSKSENLDSMAGEQACEVWEKRTGKIENKFVGNTYTNDFNKYVCVSVEKGAADTTLAEFKDVCSFSNVICASGRGGSATAESGAVAEEAKSETVLESDSKVVWSSSVTWGAASSPTESDISAAIGSVEDVTQVIHHHTTNTQETQHEHKYDRKKKIASLILDSENHAAVHDDDAVACVDAGSRERVSTLTTGIVDADAVAMQYMAVAVISKNNFTENEINTKADLEKEVEISDIMKLAMGEGSATNVNVAMKTKTEPNVDAKAEGHTNLEIGKGAEIVEDGNIKLGGTETEIGVEGVESKTETEKNEEKGTEDIAEININAGTENKIDEATEAVINFEKQIERNINENKKLEMIETDIERVTEVAPETNEEVVDINVSSEARTNDKNNSVDMLEGVEIGGNSKVKTNTHLETEIERNKNGTEKVEEVEENINVEAGGTGIEIDVASKTKIETEETTDVEIEVNMGVDAEIISKTDNETNTNEEAEKYVEIAEKVETEIEGLETGIATEIKTDTAIETSMDSGTNTEMETAQTETEAHEAIEAETNLETEIERNTNETEEAFENEGNVKVEIKGTETEKDTATETKSDTEKNIEFEVENDRKIDGILSTEARIVSETEHGTNKNVEIVIGGHIKDNVNCEVDAVTEFKTESETNAKFEVENEANPETEIQVAIDAVTNLKTEIEESATATEKVFEIEENGKIEMGGREIETNVELKQETETEVDVNVFAEAGTNSEVENETNTNVETEQYIKNGENVVAEMRGMKSEIVAPTEISTAFETNAEMETENDAIKETHGAVKAKTILQTETDRNTPETGKVLEFLVPKTEMESNTELEKEDHAEIDEIVLVEAGTISETESEINVNIATENDIILKENVKIEIGVAGTEIDVATEIKTEIEINTELEKEDDVEIDVNVEEACTNLESENGINLGENVKIEMGRIGTEVVAETEIYVPMETKPGIETTADMEIENHAKAGTKTLKAIKTKTNFEAEIERSTIGTEKTLEIEGIVRTEMGETDTNAEMETQDDEKMLEFEGNVKIKMGGTAMETNLTTETKADAETTTELETENDTGIYVNVEAATHNETNINAGNERHIKNVKNVKIEMGELETEIVGKNEKDVVTKTNIKTETNGEIEAENNAEIGGNSETKNETNKYVNTSIGVQIEENVKVEIGGMGGTETQVVAETETVARIELTPENDAKAGTEAENNAETNLETDIKRNSIKTEKVLEIEAYLRVEMGETATENDAETAMNVRSEIERNSASELETHDLTDVEINLETENETCANVDILKHIQSVGSVKIQMERTKTEICVRRETEATETEINDELGNENKTEIDICIGVETTGNTQMRTETNANNDKDAYTETKFDTKNEIRSGIEINTSATGTETNIGVAVQLETEKYAETETEIETNVERDFGINTPKKIATLTETRTSSDVTNSNKGSTSVIVAGLLGTEGKGVFSNIENENVDVVKAVTTTAEMKVDAVAGVLSSLVVSNYANQVKNLEEIPINTEVDTQIDAEKYIGTDIDVVKKVEMVSSNISNGSMQVSEDAFSLFVETNSIDRTDVKDSSESFSASSISCGLGKINAKLVEAKCASTVSKFEEIDTTAGVESNALTLTDIETFLDTSKYNEGVKRPAAVAATVSGAQSVAEASLEALNDDKCLVEPVAVESLLNAHVKTVIKVVSVVAEAESKALFDSSDPTGVGATRIPADGDLVTEQLTGIEDEVRAFSDILRQDGYMAEAVSNPGESGTKAIDLETNLINRDFQGKVVLGNPTEAVQRQKESEAQLEEQILPCNESQDEESTVADKSEPCVSEQQQMWVITRNTALQNYPLLSEENKGIKRKTQSGTHEEPGLKIRFAKTTVISIEHDSGQSKSLRNSENIMEVKNISNELISVKPLNTQALVSPGTNLESDLDLVAAKDTSVEMVESEIKLNPNLTQSLPRLDAQILSKFGSELSSGVGPQALSSKLTSISTEFVANNEQLATTGLAAASNKADNSRESLILESKTAVVHTFAENNEFGVSKHFFEKSSESQHSLGLGKENIEGETSAKIVSACFLNESEDISKKVLITDVKAAPFDGTISQGMPVKGERFMAVESKNDVKSLELEQHAVPFTADLVSQSDKINFLSESENITHETCDIFTPSGTSTNLLLKHNLDGSEHAKTTALGESQRTEKVSAGDCELDSSLESDLESDFNLSIGHWVGQWDFNSMDSDASLQATGSAKEFEAEKLLEEFNATTEVIVESVLNAAKDLQMQTAIPGETPSTQICPLNTSNTSATSHSGSVCSATSSAVSCTCTSCASTATGHTSTTSSSASKPQGSKTIEPGSPNADRSKEFNLPLELSGEIMLNDDLLSSSDIIHEAELLKEFVPISANEANAEPNANSDSKPNKQLEQDMSKLCPALEDDYELSNIVLDDESQLDDDEIKWQQKNILKQNHLRSKMKEALGKSVKGGHNVIAKEDNETIKCKSRSFVKQTSDVNINKMVNVSEKAGGSNLPASTPSSLKSGLGRSKCSGDQMLLYGTEELYLDDKPSTSKAAAAGLAKKAKLAATTGSCCDLTARQLGMLKRPLPEFATNRNKRDRLEPNSSENVIMEEYLSRNALLRSVESFSLDSDNLQSDITLPLKKRRKLSEFQDGEEANSLTALMAEDEDITLEETDATVEADATVRSIKKNEKIFLQLVASQLHTFLAKNYGGNKGGSDCVVQKDLPKPGGNKGGSDCVAQKDLPMPEGTDKKSVKVNLDEGSILPIPQSEIVTCEADSSSVGVATNADTEASKEQLAEEGFATLAVPASPQTTRSRAPPLVQVVAPQQKSVESAGVVETPQNEPAPGVTAAIVEFTAGEWEEQLPTSYPATPMFSIAKYEKLVRLEMYIDSLMKLDEVARFAVSFDHDTDRGVDVAVFEEARAAILEQATVTAADGSSNGGGSGGVSKALLLKQHSDGSVSILNDNDDGSEWWILPATVADKLKHVSTALAALQQQYRSRVNGGGVRERIELALSQLLLKARAMQPNVAREAQLARLCLPGQTGDATATATASTSATADFPWQNHLSESNLPDLVSHAQEQAGVVQIAVCTGTAPKQTKSQSPANETLSGNRVLVSACETRATTIAETVFAGKCPTKKKDAVGLHELDMNAVILTNDDVSVPPFVESFEPHLSNAVWSKSFSSNNGNESVKDSDNSYHTQQSIASDIGYQPMLEQPQTQSFTFCLPNMQTNTAPTGHHAVALAVPQTDRTISETTGQCCSAAQFNQKPRTIASSPPVSCQPAIPSQLARKRRSSQCKSTTTVRSHWIESVQKMVQHHKIQHQIDNQHMTKLQEKVKHANQSESIPKSQSSVAGVPLRSHPYPQNSALGGGAGGRVAGTSGIVKIPQQHNLLMSNFQNRKQMRFGPLPYGQRSIIRCDVGSIGGTANLKSAEQRQRLLHQPPRTISQQQHFEHTELMQQLQLETNLPMNISQLGGVNVADNNKPPSFSAVQTECAKVLSARDTRRHFDLGTNMSRTRDGGMVRTQLPPLTPISGVGADLQRHQTDVHLNLMSEQHQQLALPQLHSQSHSQSQPKLPQLQQWQLQQSRVAEEHRENEVQLLQLHQQEPNRRMGSQGMRIFDGKLQPENELHESQQQEHQQMEQEVSHAPAARGRGGGRGGRRGRGQQQKQEVQQTSQFYQQPRLQQLQMQLQQQQCQENQLESQQGQKMLEKGANLAPPTRGRGGGRGGRRGRGRPPKNFTNIVQPRPDPSSVPMPMSVASPSKRGRGRGSTTSRATSRINAPRTISHTSSSIAPAGVVPDNYGVNLQTPQLTASAQSYFARLHQSEPSLSVTPQGSASTLLAADGGTSEWQRPSQQSSMSNEQNKM